MEIDEEIHNANKKIIVLKDELGNIATGASYKEALRYLKYRRTKNNKERGSKNGMV